MYFICADRLFLGWTQEACGLKNPCFCWVRSLCPCAIDSCLLGGFTSAAAQAFTWYKLDSRRHRMCFCGKNLLSRIPSKQNMAISAHLWNLLGLHIPEYFMLASYCLTHTCWTSPEIVGTHLKVLTLCPSFLFVSFLRIPFFLSIVRNFHIKQCKYLCTGTHICVYSKPVCLHNQRVIVVNSLPCLPQFFFLAASWLAGSWFPCSEIAEPSPMDHWGVPPSIPENRIFSDKVRVPFDLHNCISYSTQRKPLSWIWFI